MVLYRQLCTDKDVCEVCGYGSKCGGHARAQEGSGTNVSASSEEQQNCPPEFSVLNNVIELSSFPSAARQDVKCKSKKERIATVPHRNIGCPPSASRPLRLPHSPTTSPPPPPRTGEPDKHHLDGEAQRAAALLVLQAGRLAGGGQCGVRPLAAPPGRLELLGKVEPERDWIGEERGGRFREVGGDNRDLWEVCTPPCILPY